MHELLATENRPFPVSIASSANVPAIIDAAGPHVRRRFVEFFTANIRNPNTREAYYRAVCGFASWCDEYGVELERVEPSIVAAYIEQLMRQVNSRTGRPMADATVKQHLAGIRMLFDYLTTGGVVGYNPAAAVRGPKIVVEKGKTPVLSADDARLLLDSIDCTRISGLRDRALIGVMVFAFARVGATLKMNVGDLYENGRTLWLRLHEKGGRYHEMPCHHKLAQYLDEYVEAAGIRERRSSPLFCTLGRTRTLTEFRLTRQDAWAMVKRRARAAGVSTEICCHSFRATGITTFVKNGGTPENARKLAAHRDQKTTNMYIRVDDELSQEEVERVRI